MYGSEIFLIGNIIQWLLVSCWRSNIIVVSILYGMVYEADLCAPPDHSLIKWYPTEKTEEF